MAILLYLFLCLVWSSTWLVIKIGLGGIPPFLGAGLRFTLATAILWLILLARKKKSSPLTRDDKISILSCGSNFAVNYGLVYWSEQHIPSGLAALLFSTMPLMVALLSRFWTRSETLPARKIAGILSGIGGTAVIFWPAEGAGRLAVLGMLGVLGATLSAAVNLVVIKKHSRHTDVFVLNACGMAIGTACLLAMSFLLESRAAVVWTPETALSIVYLSLFGTVAAFLAYYHLIKTMHATHLSTITLICPVIAIGLGWFFLGEAVSLRTLAGVAAILGGVALTVRSAESPLP